MQCCFTLLWMTTSWHYLDRGGFYQRLGAKYWNDEVRKIIGAFTKDDYVGGICAVIKDIGVALQREFPYESNDKNELPDEKFLEIKMVPQIVGLFFLFNT